MSTKPRRPVDGRGDCPICGSQRKLTDEDIVPTWARKYLIGLAPFGPRDQRPSRITMRICITCNSRMAKVFEDRCSSLIKPMLDGSQVCLSHREQSQISAWIVKTSLLITAMGLPRDAPDRDRSLALVRHLIDERIPPAQTLVRLFLHSMADEEVATGHVPSEALAPPTAFFSISSVGSLGWEMAIGPTLPILEYQSRTSGRQGFVQVWPPVNRQVFWPPATPIGTADIKRLRSAYLSSSRPGIASPVIRQWQWPGPASSDPRTPLS